MKTVAFFSNFFGSNLLVALPAGTSSYKSVYHIHLAEVLSDKVYLTFSYVTVKQYFSWNHLTASYFNQNA